MSQKYFRKDFQVEILFDGLYHHNENKRDFFSDLTMKYIDRWGFPSINQEIKFSNFFFEVDRLTYESSEMINKVCVHLRTINQEQQH